MKRSSYQEQIARLKEEQDRAIKETDEQIQKWNGFKSDYEALKQRLTTLPDQVSHDVMVPFGKLAFIPGKLVHTNEILVLLGDNWFAERSAKQAVGIVNRRMKEVDKQLEDLDRQRKLLEPRRDFTSDLQEIGRDGAVDIREDYDEEKERIWKERHSERVKKHRQRLKEDISRGQISQEVTPDSDDKLWARLDELEKVESEGQELEKIGKEDSQQNSDQYPWKHKRTIDTDTERDLDAANGPDFVKENAANRDNTESEELSETSDTTEELDSDDEESFTDEGDCDNSGEAVEIVSGGKVINFTHSGNQANNAEETNAVIHPGMLYSKFYANRQPKSILKKTTSDQKKTVKKKTRRRVVEFDTGSDTDEKNRTMKPVQSAPSVPAFTGTVVEKQSANCNPIVTAGAASGGQSLINMAIPKDSKELGAKHTEQSTTSKPVSKFKARKQNKVEL